MLEIRAIGQSFASAGTPARPQSPLLGKRSRGRELYYFRDHMPVTTICTRPNENVQYSMTLHSPDVNSALEVETSSRHA